MCNKSLEISQTNVKAFYQRGLAHKGLQNYEDAMKDIKSAVILNPKDKAMRTMYSEVKKLKQS